MTKEPRAASGEVDALSQQALDALPLHVAVLDESGTIVFENETWRRFGHERGRRPGRGASCVEICREVAAGDEVRERELSAALRRLLAGEASEFACDYSITRGDEITHWTVRFTRFRDGASKRIVCSHDEISARERTRRELESSRAEADRANRAKSAFLAAVTHDARNPLHAILGFAELALHNSALPEALRPDLKMVGRAASRLLVLVNRILELSELENDSWSLVPGVVAVADLLDELRVLHAAAREPHPPRWSVEVQPTVPPALELDVVRTRRLLALMIENSTGAGAPAGIRIAVEFSPRERDTGELLFTVDVEERVEPRSAGAPPDGGDDAGDAGGASLGASTRRIGSAVVEALLRRLNGSLELQRIGDGGSKTTVALPVRIASGAARSSAPDSPPASPTLPTPIDEASVGRLDAAELVVLERAAATADFATLEAARPLLERTGAERAARIRLALDEFDYPTIRRELAAFRARELDAAEARSNVPGL